MRHALVGAIGLMALLFAASAVAVDLSRVLPSFELPAAPRLRTESPQPQGPDAVIQPKASTVETRATAGSAAVAPNPDESSISPTSSPAKAADAAVPAAPTRRERGWREMLPGLLHQP